ncbi:NrfA- nitrite reduction protein [Acuticoccus sediminis]|uniref:nitrite reductase (cytochrome; ammonia-forming) n=2 Tax=Acuticoccus sediminis TaxID=2184697 RepID=A0A8B2P4V5_9HYPH|nr:NrfA- nitrite reduction protein [Acuticoccus sediminis]
MRMSRNALLWCLWVGLTLAAGGALASIAYVGGARDIFLIGRTTGAHHQIEVACEACHTSGFFADRVTVRKDMNKACLTCHEEELKEADDSHPVKKFRDPRNVARRAELDALYCITCHAEHVPEETRVGAVTLPMDYCMACHQDVYENRPTHKGYGFETCASAGCHNFHDNTALYEDFLLRHAAEPDFAADPVQPFSAAARSHPRLTAILSDDPVASLKAYLENAGTAPDEAGEDARTALAEILRAGDAVAPDGLATPGVVAAWAASKHATSGVNCGGCHAPEADPADRAALAAAWTPSPGMETCRDCHKRETDTFREGRHAMRFHPALPEPRKAPENAVLAALTAPFRDVPLTAMTVDKARIPMKPDAHGESVGTCGQCHAPHQPDLATAAVEACASCHDDPHTRAYFTSPHFRLWEAERDGTAPAGTGVTCGDCHMPKIELRRGRFFVTHNQNATLRPNEKMIRPVCLNCHGLSFAIDALADPELVERNFNGRPSAHVPSIDWARSRTEGGK